MKKLLELIKHVDNNNWAFWLILLGIYLFDAFAPALLLLSHSVFMLVLIVGITWLVVFPAGLLLLGVVVYDIYTIVKMAKNQDNDKDNKEE